MARVVVMPPFDREFFGGRDRLEVDAGNLFQAVTALDRLGPGFAAVAEVRASFAVDGTVTGDWSKPIDATSEVILLQRVSGG